MIAAAVQELRLLLTAVQYFTRVPVPAWIGYSPQQLNQSARHFPLVGLLVGAAIATVYWGAHFLWPPVVAVVLAIAFGVLLTGGFHEDGLADACDGFGGGYTTERVLAIMKDSRIGAFGAMGLVLTFAGKIALLSTLPATAAVIALVAAHAASRAAVVVVIGTQRYVRDESDARAKPMAQSIGTGGMLYGIAVAGLPTLAGGAPAAAGVVVLAAVVAAAALYFRSRIGGYTGDCLGATQQLGEIGFYLGFTAWFSI